MTDKKLTKFGFVLSQLGPNQLTYQFVSAANTYLAKADDVDIIGFWVNDGPRPVQSSFAMMPLIESYAWNGYTICTSLHTASRIIGYPGPSRKTHIYHYIFDLDWLRLPQKQFDALASIYMNPKTQLIVRSQAHYDIVKSVWRKPIGIVKDFNMDQFKEIING